MLGPQLTRTWHGIGQRLDMTNNPQLPLKIQVFALIGSFWVGKGLLANQDTVTVECFNVVFPG